MTNLLQLYSEGRLTQEDLAVALSTTIMSVRQTLFKAKLKLTKTPTKEWAEELNMMHFDAPLKELANQYLVSIAVIKHMRYQYNEQRQHPDRTSLKQAAIKGDKTQAELAKEFGVTQATVSRHNPKRREYGNYRKRLNPTEWHKVKQYLATNGGNIAEAARHFNTTRQTIYRKLQNDN